MLPGTTLAAEADPARQAAVTALTATRLRNFQLHRTTISDAGLRPILAALPRIPMNWQELPMENGLDALGGLPSLRHVILDPANIPGF